jgi:hypothetical protein
MIDVEAVRARHAEAESDGRCGDIAWDEDYALSAHMDRRDFLRALDEALAENAWLRCERAQVVAQIEAAFAEIQTLARPRAEVDDT